MPARARTPVSVLDQNKFLLALLSESPLGFQCSWFTQVATHTDETYVTGRLVQLEAGGYIYSIFDLRAFGRYYFLTANGWLQAMALECEAGS